MKNINNYEYLLKDLTELNGVGKKTTEILKKKQKNQVLHLKIPKLILIQSLKKKYKQ